MIGQARYGVPTQENGRGRKWASRQPDRCSRPTDWCQLDILLLEGVVWDWVFQLETFAVDYIIEVVVVRVTRAFGQIVLEIIEPVAGIIAGTGRGLDSDFLIGIIKETIERDLTVGRG